MKTINIKINGLISQEQLNNYNIQYPCNEVCKSYHITLPENKPNIELILELSLNAKISNWKHIVTHGKNKFFIEGLLNSKVFFKSNLSSKNIYYTEFSRPFSETLPIENVNTLNLEPAIFIEDAFINHINKKSFSISTLMVICTILDNNKSSKKNVDIISNNNLQMPVGDINTTSNYNHQMPLEDINPTSIYNPKISAEDISAASNNNLKIPIDTINVYLKDNLQIPAEIIDESLKNTSKEQKKNSINVNIEYDMNTGEEYFK